MSDLGLSSGDLQECLYALYAVRERINQYAHPDYEARRMSLEPVERLIERIRSARDSLKTAERARRQK